MPANHQTFLKLLITVVVFPALFLAFLQLWSLLFLLLDWIAPGRWAPVRTGLLITSIVVALFGAFTLCRRMWPEAKSPETLPKA